MISSDRSLLFANDLPILSVLGYELLESDTWCGEDYISIYETYNEAIEACNDDLDCTCLDYDADDEYTPYFTNRYLDIEQKNGWTASVTLIYKFVHLYDSISLFLRLN